MSTENQLFTARDIAILLTEPGQDPLIPTAEQQAVIESPPEHAVLVVAGAGSGKTETLANRVIWLVANGLVRPSEVLGLTFTRKAAGELAERMRGRLIAFIDRASTAPITPEQQIRVGELQHLLSTSLDLPEVSTYNGFASGVVQEFGGATGVGGQLIDEAVAWGIAREVVTTSRDPRLADLGIGVNRLTEHTLQLAHTITDHLSTFDRARQATETFATASQLPYDAKALEKAISGTKVYKAITDQIDSFAQTRVLIDLAEEFSRVKRERGVLEFSDQIALALESLRTTPEAKSILRQRHKIVLLDEVQDTSVAQTTLLATLFRGAHVMGVGDPHQSIYGWRGASTESLTGFHEAFQSTDRPVARTLTLSTSWRNSRSVLQAANRAAIPLRKAATIPVPVLVPRPHATDGKVSTHYAETLDEEVRTVAEWMRDRRAEFARVNNGDHPTAAVIVRKRKYLAVFAEELRNLGLPCRIIGVGGLLSTPEVRDLVSALRCVWYADASNDLIRILVGPRFAIGPADIAGLRSAARWFAKRDYTHRQIDLETVTKGQLESLDREVSLVDALDLIPSLTEGHQATESISPTGLLRMREAALMLRKLRSLIAGDVIDLMRTTSHELHLDIELEAHERYSTTESANARENLQSIAEAVRSFLQVSPDRSLRAVLEWLEHSEREDALPAYIPPPEPGSVQLITVHSAKGLEWDYVAVPRQSETEFPSKPRSSRGGLAVGVIPDECRGDARSRPVFEWSNAKTQQEVRDLIDEYQAEQAALFAEEELRLIYVAYTRAKHELFLTGSFWSKNVKSTAPAEPLRALHRDFIGAYEGELEKTEYPLDTQLVHPLPTSSEYDELPQIRPPQTLTWPLDPLGSRHERVHAAAAAVANTETPNEPDPLALLLLTDAKKLGAGEAEEALFTRINASSFHDFVSNPLEASSRALRPLPSRPFRRTRIGNLFHDWVEHRTTTPVGTVLELSFETAEDVVMDDTERHELAKLITTFEASRWATRQPILVEEQITIPFAGRRAVCKLDAVYEIDGRIEIVDWKTGRPPRTGQEQQDRFLQLDLYRVAYAIHTGTPLDRIDVCLYYVEDDFELRSQEPRTLAELEALWGKAYTEILEGRTTQS